MRDFEQVYRKYAAAVYRASLRYTGRPEIAEEITSEAFLALYQHFQQVDDSQLPAWLFTVAKRRAIDVWRKQAQENKAMEGMTEVREELPAGEDVEVLLARCRELKPIHRMCLMLRYVHGMSRSEIAARVGLEETQIKGYLQYGLKLLKQHFTQGGNATDAEPA